MVSFLIFDEFENILGDLLHGLNEFGLVRVTSIDAFHECRKVDVIGNRHRNSSPICRISARSTTAPAKLGDNTQSPRTSSKSIRTDDIGFLPFACC
jgi:hypothetical protein